MYNARNNVSISKIFENEKETSLLESLSKWRKNIFERDVLGRSPGARCGLYTCGCKGLKFLWLQILATQSWIKLRGRWNEHTWPRLLISRLKFPKTHVRRFYKRHGRSRSLRFFLRRYFVIIHTFSRYYATTTARGIIYTFILRVTASILTQCLKLVQAKETRHASTSWKWTKIYTPT